MPFHSIGEQYNPMEMLRGMMRPTAGGAVSGGEDPTDKLIRWKMMNDLLKDAGGVENRPQNRPTMVAQSFPQAMQMVPPQAMPTVPPAAYMSQAPISQAPQVRDSRMERYLQKQQYSMLY